LLANLRDTLPGAAQLSQRVLGLAAQRSLPRWRRDTFLASHAAHAAAATNPEVVLLVDTFNNFHEPENAHAALRVLQAAGYRVAVARALDSDGERTRPLCCGRTYLTAGLVDDARREARRLIDAVLPHVAGGAVMVGLEPSCLLSLRDEFLVMGLGEDAERIAPRALLLEEFLAREHAAGRLRLSLKALSAGRALVHGHCHQKAFDAMGSVVDTLKLIPGLTVEVVESSCCGMAGSFGYEATHLDVSMKMAELSLLPAVRAASADTIVVADGTSCRHQIADGTAGARRALHVARVLSQALANDQAACR
jgi:Fe-S oxidoreductase